MLQINLLPPKEKRALETEKILRIARFFGALFALLFCAGLIFLLPSYVVLAVQRNALEKSLRAEEELAEKRKPEELLSEAGRDGAVLKRIEESVRRPARAGTLSDIFFDPANPVRVNQFSVRKDRTLRLDGFAATRGDLLKFEQKLNATGYFEKISFPLSSIVKESDIPFSLQGQLKSDYGF